MSEQYAVITGADMNQVDRTWVSEGLKTFESGGKISLTAIGRRDYKQEIIGSFKQGSGGRSYRYYSFNNLKNAQKDASVDQYRVPVYGVRGTSDISRAIGYACVYISSCRDMAGLDFYSHVFGSRYLTEEEIRTSADPVSLTEQEPVMPKLSVSPRNRETAYAIVESLSRAQERDTNSKLLIVIDNAETESMELLKDVYLLLPGKMRLNYGFATNLTVKMYEELFRQQSLPIQLLTMDSEVYRGSIDRIRTLDPLLCVLDLNSLQPGTVDPGISRQLDRFLEKGINRKNDLLFAFAEQQVIRKHNNVPSMQFYPEMLEKYLEGGGLWWKNPTLDRMEAVREAYEEQQILMDDDEIRQEAVGSFYFHMLPEKDYADEIAYMQLGKETGALTGDLSSKAEKCLSFVRDKLKYGKILKAVETAIREMNKKRDSEISKLEEDHKEEVRRLKDDSDAQKDKIYNQQKKNDELTRKNSELEAQNRKLKDDLGNYTSQGWGKSPYERLKNDYDSLQEKYQKERNETEDLEQKAGRGKILTIVFGALFGLTAVGAIGYALAVVKPEQNRQKQEIERLQATIETEQELAESRESRISALETELTRQEESARQQESSLSSDKERLESELEEARNLLVISESEKNTPAETLAQSSNGYTDANGDFRDDITGAEIAPADSDGDGYDDRTGWYIDVHKRKSNGLIEGDAGPIRKVTESAEEGAEPALIGTIQDESVKKLYTLRTSGAISAFDVNGDWIDDISKAEIQKPEEGYHSETGWLVNWVDHDSYGEAEEVLSVCNGMDDSLNLPVCDYSKIPVLVPAARETEAAAGAGNAAQEGAAAGEADAAQVQAAAGDANAALAGAETAS